MILQAGAFMYGKRLNDLKQQYPRDIAPLTFLA